LTAPKISGVRGLRWVRAVHFAWAAGLASLLVNAVLCAALFDASWWAPDDGYYANVAERVLEGEVLHRDVQEIHTGAIVAVNALALSLFGRSLVALRLPLVAGCLAAGVLLAWAFRRRSPALGLVAAVLPTLLGVLQFVNPSAHWYSLFQFFALAVCAAEIPRGARGRVALLGFLAGLIVLFRQLSGALAAVGLVAWLLVENRGAPEAPPGSRRLARAVLALATLGLAAYLLRIADLSGIALFGLGPMALLLWSLAKTDVGDRECAKLLGRLALGGAAPFVPLLIYHAVHGSLRPWLSDTLLATTGLLKLDFMGERRLASVVARGLVALGAAGNAREVVNALFWTLLPLSGVALAAALVLASVRKKALGPLPFLAAFYAVVSLHQQIPVYLFFAVSAPLAGLLWLAASAGPWAKWGTAAVVAALAAVGGAYHAGQPIVRPWNDLVAGRKVGLVDCGLPRCGLRIPAVEQRVYARAVALIAAETAPGEEIFAFPCQAELYFLSGRPNPFPFWNTAVGVADRERLAAVLARLHEAPPRLVFYNPHDKYNTAASRQIAAAVARSYDRLGRLGPFEVYRAP
jgi:hypothetical protein